MARPQEFDTTKVLLPGFHVMVRAGVDRSQLEDALQVLLANLD